MVLDEDCLKRFSGTRFEYQPVPEKSLKVYCNIGWAETNDCTQFKDLGLEPSGFGWVLEL